MLSIIDDIAQLAFLTEPVPGQFVFNVMFEQSEIQRIQITRNQLAEIVIEGTRCLLDRAGGKR